MVFCVEGRVLNWRVTSAPAPLRARGSLAALMLPSPAPVGDAVTSVPRHEVASIEQALVESRTTIPPRFAIWVEEWVRRSNLRSRMADQSFADLRLKTGKFGSLQMDNQSRKMIGSVVGNVWSYHGANLP
jgi:hypothetical protein